MPFRALGRWELRQQVPCRAAELQPHCRVRAWLRKLHLSARIFSKQFAQGTNSSWHKISSALTAALHLKQQ